MLGRALSLALLACLIVQPGAAAIQLHSWVTLEGPAFEPTQDALRWLWERSRLRLGVVDRHDPPFDLLGTGQTYEGITADYASLVAARLRLQVEVQVFATQGEAFAALRDARIDLVGSVTARQAQDAGLRLSYPYAEDRPMLMAARPTGAPSPGSGMRLALVEGYRPLEQILAGYPLAQVQWHASPFSAMAALVLGQADVYIGDGLKGRYLLGRSQLFGVEAVGHAELDSEAIGFAMLDSTGPLATLVDEVLGSLGQPQHEQIRRRWSPLAMAAYDPAALQLSAAEQRWIDDNPVVRVVMDEQLLPLSYRDAKAGLQGLSLDILQLIGQRTGLRFEVQDTGTIEQMIGWVRQGRAQVIAGLPYSPQRARELSFSRAYLSASRVLVTREDAPGPASLAGLEGLRLGVILGSAVPDLVTQRYPGIRLQAYGGPLEALHGVSRGQVSAAVLTYDDARTMIARWYPGRVKIAASVSLPPAHFALATARGEQELQSILNKALLSLAPQETDALVRRWRNPLIVGDGVWSRYRGKILGGFAAALGLLLLALVWIRYLRRLQREAAQARREAETANQAKTDFLTTMSHEIRTPLHALLGMLELAQRKADQGVLDRMAIEVATDAARGLLELIGDILDVSRIEAGRLQLAPQRVVLGEQVASVVQLFEEQARAKGLVLELDMRGAQACEVMLDPLRFKQILANVLSNAIKFTGDGQVRVDLQARAQGARLTVELVVEDTGIGIAADELAALGQLFRQASNQRQSPRHSAGLGLGISRSLCQMMGGHLRLDSVLGQGTRVGIHLELPLLIPQEANEGPTVPSAMTHFTRLRVLVVDDCSANRLLLAQQLDYLGHQARVAEDGTQALGLWLQEHFDVVISDCNMPRLGGQALARAIREHERRSERPRCRVIGLTASALADERDRCRAAGMDGCLFKPLGLQDLERILTVCRPTSGANACDQPILDIAHLMRLVGKDQAALNALLADLRSSNRTDLNQLHAFRHQTRVLAQLAHRVKGAARIVRARTLVDLCERLERTCAEPSPSPVQLAADVQALRTAMQRLDRQLERHAAAGGMAGRHIIPSNNNTSSTTSTAPTMPDGP
ncbi:transporter substrate-binding domain-containing protein [Pseudomonas putida]|uniref:transporter substrate-binding domain-containing protein n=1 Tax=Pseudomonas putida TaxID=303 RepID=UPI00383B63F4